MKILVTGAKGFIGKNLVVELHNRGYQDVFEYDVDTKIELLDNYTKECDFVFHLAGINRPQNDIEFMNGNVGFTSLLLNLLKSNNNKPPVLITSSIQADFDNLYGKSKKAGEDLMIEYSVETSSRIFIYRLQNVFGKWCKPNYNSVVATFCHNIARGIDITVSDSNVNMQLAYIDDVVSEFISMLCEKEHKKDNYYSIHTVHKVTLGEIVDLLYSFKNSRKNLSVPTLNNTFEKALYSTYLSYLPENNFSYPLKMNIDTRGSFTEIIKTSDRGQFSVNVSKPHITKGNHWHNTKVEKFVVVSGKAIIQFRKIGTSEITEYYVCGDKMEVIDIPVGYTHNIINDGDTDLITFMWCNEHYDPDKPDTYFEVV